MAGATTMVQALSSGLGLVISLFTTVGFIVAGFAWQDSRHAPMDAIDDINTKIELKVAQVEKEVQGIYLMIQESEIASVEYQIERAQRQMVRIIRIPEDERTREEVGTLEDLKFEIEFKKRELRRLENSLDGD